MQNTAQQPTNTESPISHKGPINTPTSRIPTAINTANNEAEHNTLSKRRRICTSSIIALCWFFLYLAQVHKEIAWVLPSVWLSSWTIFSLFGLKQQILHPSYHRNLSRVYSRIVFSPNSLGTTADIETLHSTDASNIIFFLLSTKAPYAITSFIVELKSHRISIVWKQWCHEIKDNWFLQGIYLMVTLRFKQLNEYTK